MATEVKDDSLCSMLRLLSIAATALALCASSVRLAAAEAASARWKADLALPMKLLRAVDLGLEAGQAFVFAGWEEPDPSTPANPHNFHERWLMYAVQGMANRAEPLVWIGPDGMLKKYYEAERGYTFVDRRADSFDDFLARFAPHFNGIVIYAEQPSDCAIVAINLANQNFCLPVSQAVYERHAQALRGLEVVARIDGDGLDRQAAYRWLTENVLPRCDGRTAFSLHQAFPDNRIPAGECAWDAAGDIPFRFRSFVFNLPCTNDRCSVPGEAGLFADIMRALKPPAMVFGWNTAEAGYSPYGHMMGHCQNVANGSFIASVPIRGRFPFRQNRQPGIDQPEAKVYVSFVSNEGDTLRMLAHGYWNAWQKPERGSVPLNWAVCPAYAEYFPTLFEYYYETRSSNDTFCFAPTGAGYVHTDLMPPDKVDRFLQETERLSRDYLDLHEVIAWGCNNHDVWRKMAAMPGVRAIFPKPNGGPDQGRLFQIEGIGTRVPVLRESFGHYWITNTGGHAHERGDAWTPAILADKLHERSGAAGKPSFFILYSAEGDAPRFVAETVSHLDRSRVEVVDLVTFSHLLAQVPADYDQAPPEAAVADPLDLGRELVHDATEWKPVNESRISQVPDGLRIELVDRAWGGVALSNVQLPTDSTGLAIRVASMTAGRWEIRIGGIHLDPDHPDTQSTIVGIQANSDTQGPYPGGVFRSDFDPRILAKVRKGEIIPSIQLIYSHAEPGDSMVVSGFEPIR